MRFHYEKIGDRCDQQVYAILCARDHLPFDWHTLGMQKRSGAAVGVKGPESWHEPLDLALPSSHWGFEKINLDNDDRPFIVEVNGCVKLVLLVGLFVSSSGTHPPTTTMLSANHDPSTCPRSMRTRRAASIWRWP
jgi:hypothetical protein